MGLCPENGRGCSPRRCGLSRRPPDTDVSALLSSRVGIPRSMQDIEDDDIPLISGSGEGLMDEGPALHAGARRNEDIALDLMKFIAMTTGYGKTASSGGVGFSGGGAAAKPEDYAAHLLELYGKCLGAVAGKKEQRERAGAGKTFRNLPL